MKCQLCGMEYRASDGIRACKGCPMSGNCGRLKCPGCGYENPVESKLLKMFGKRGR